MLIRTTYIAILATMLFFSCKNDDASIPITFNNSSNKTIIVKVYSSQADYFDEVNIIGSLVLQPFSGGEISGEAFEDGRTYYYDWQTEDDSFSNWGHNEYPRYYPSPLSATPGAEFITFQYPSTDKIECGNGTMDRLLFLGGNNQSATWKPVDAYDGGGGEAWTTMPAHYKNITLTLSKDYSAVFTYQVPNGDIITEYLRIEPSDGDADIYGWQPKGVRLSQHPKWDSPFPNGIEKAIFMIAEISPYEYILKKH